MKKILKTFLNRKSLYYVFGLVLLALGIRLTIESNLGAAPWDMLCTGLYERTGISIGIWQIVNNILMIMITKLLFRQRWNIICLIPGVILGTFIDFFAFIEPLRVMNEYVVLLLGCIISGLGLSIYMNQGLSANAIDNFVYTMTKVRKMRSGICKLICDSIPLVLILFLGIQFRVATIAVYFFVPIFMQMFIQLFKFSIPSTDMLEQD